MIKRTIDIILSFIGLLLLAPIFVVISVWIKLDSPGPVFFRQTRVGRYGEFFRIHKFRTMRTKTEHHGSLTVGADSRITRPGFFLRKYKIDELPQLIDVFLGDMSLVGPRPEVPQFVKYYPDDVKDKILSVKPGITDRASIEMIDENELLGRYEDPRQAYVDIILPEKLRFYLDYAKNHSVWSDFRIIFLTIIKIIRR